MTGSNSNKNKLFLKLSKVRYLPLFLGIAVFILVVTFGLYIKFTTRNISQDSNLTTDQDIIEKPGELSEKLPERFPQDIPILDDTTLVKSYQDESDVMYAMTVVWETQKPLLEIRKFYEDKLKEGGWIYELAGNESQSITVSFRKAGKEGFIAATDAENDRIITITLRVDK